MVDNITSTAAYKAAEMYERFIVSGVLRYWTPIFLQRLAPQPGERMLDVACGTGVVARSVVPLVEPDGRVVALDINPAMLAVACKQFSDYCEDIDWREGQAESLPFPDQAFDLVMCQQGLQFFNNRSAAVHEMHRVLRKNGRVGIAVWQSLETHVFYHTFFKAVASAFDVPIADIATPYMFGDRHALADLLENAGFAQVQVVEVRQNACFPNPNQFVELMVRGASAAVPGLARLDFSRQEEIFEIINERLAGLIQEYTIDGILTVPMVANIALARRGSG